MAELVLSDEQARIVSQSTKPISVRDGQGRVLGQLEPELTPQMIAELKRRLASPGPWYSSEQVESRLKALQEEWDRLGGFDEAYMKEFLRRLNDADPGRTRSKATR